MQRFPIGTKYQARNGKITRLCEVVDFYVTRDLAGEIVREEYVTAHGLLGQQILERVCDTTIARGLLPEFAHLLKG